MPLSFVEMVHFFSISFSIFNSQYVFFLHFRWVVALTWQQLRELMTTNDFLQHMTTTTSNAIDWDKAKRTLGSEAEIIREGDDLRRTEKTKHSRRRFLTDKDNRLKSFQYYLKNNFTSWISSNLWWTELINWTENRHFNNQKLTSIKFVKIDFRKKTRRCVVGD